MKHRTSTQWLDFRRLNDRNYCDTWLVGRLMQRYSIHQVARHYKAICGASDTLEAVYQESVRNPAAMEWMMRFNPAVGWRGMKLLGLEIRRVRELKRRGPRGIINQAAVLRFAHECGKRPTPDFIEWLEEQVKDQIDPRRRAARMMELAKRRTQLVLDGNIVTGATDEAPPQEQPGAADCSRDTPTAEGPAGPVDQGRGCPG